MTYMKLRDSILTSPTASDWLKAVILELERRNPLDAAGDADYLAQLMRLRAKALFNGELPASAIYGVADT